MNRPFTRGPGLLEGLLFLWLLLAFGACSGDTGDDDDDASEQRSDLDEDGWSTEAGDCDDYDPGIYPGAPELCDGRDNDCDGFSDNAPDRDGDSFTECTGDCDDGDAARHPGVTDRCDGVDDDCDGGIDEDARLSTWYADRDADGFGNPAVVTFSCPNPDGFVADASDCDDLAAAVHPGAGEVCGDGIDNDCDGISSLCSLRSPLSLARADARLSGARPGDRAGYSVNSLLDMNGDGFDDFAVSAPGEDTGGPDAGAVYLVYGPVTGEVPLEVAEARILGEAASDNAGHFVASAGDVNGDGIPDLLVGVPYADQGGENAGAAALFFGPLEGDLPLSAADAILVGEAAGALAGWSVSAGDVDGDGIDDVVVGAPGESGGGLEAGAVYVVYGPVEGSIELGEADAKLSGARPADRAGYSVNSIRDMDGDGTADLIIGAPYEDTGGEDAGAVYLVPGPVTGAKSLADGPVARFGARPADRAGYSVNSIRGDSPDELPALVVGAPFEDTGGVDAGAVYVARGPLDGTGSLEAAETKLFGARPTDRAGYSVNSIRDGADGGGSALVVGAPYEDTGGADAGAVYLVHGLPEGAFSLEEADVKLVGEGAGHNAGFSVAPAGDVDGGGLPDLLIGAPGLSAPDSLPGNAYLVLGPVSGRLYLELSSVGARFSGDEGGRTGTAVAPAGDLDGDGFDDLLIGAPDDGTGGEGAGAVYVISGDPELAGPLSAAAVIRGGPGDALGQAVASAGDVDGDGRDDLLVAAPYGDAGAANGGVVALFRGPVSGELELTDADVWLLGDSAGGLAGWSVAGVGDANDDGLDDVLVGVPNDARGGAGAGAAYLFHGPLEVLHGSIPLDITLSEADAILVGEAAGDGAGWSVAGAGDVDGDGGVDLVVGAPYHAGTDGSTGVAYLVSGQVTGTVRLDQAAARLTGGPGEVIGLAVAGPGDVDGDGRADLLLGAPHDNGGGAGAGAAFLVHGPVSGPVSLASAGLKLTGEAAHDRAGSAVSSAGDLNRDGYADLFIGAPGVSDQGADGGAAYVIYGPVGAGLDLSAADLELGGEPGSLVGSAVAPAGDLDGDGTIDLVIGAPAWDGGETATGAAWIIPGSR